MLLSLVALLFPLAQQAGPSGRPVIEEGREAEITALFDGLGTGEMEGWYTERISIPYDRIRARFLGPHDEEVVLELRFPSKDESALARTPSFEIFLVRAIGIESKPAAAFAAAVARSVARREGENFWRKQARKEDQPPPSAPADEATTWIWLVGLAVLLILIGCAIAWWRPWRRR